MGEQKRCLMNVWIIILTDMLMKNWMIFLCGLLSGVILTILVAFILYASQDNNDTITSEIGKEEQQMDNNGIKMFEEPGDIMDVKSLKVFQVLANKGALAMGKSKGSNMYLGMTYLLINNEGKSYYDEEIINLPKGKVIRQMGIYHYPTRDGFEKTVPIVEIVDK